MDFDKKVQLSDPSILELKWWLNNVETKHGKLIRPMPEHVICRTDASFLGYGGIDLSSETHTNGRWASEEKHNKSINYLELLAIFYSDNTTAVSYISEFGGMASSDMDVLAKSIWMWCIERNSHLSATHIHEPGASFTDAFSVSWQNMSPYVFPPFNIVGKVINKIIQDEVDECIIIFPFWCAQSWFTMILENMCSFPVRLPRHRDLLTLAHNREEHPLGRKFRLIAATVSGKHSKVEVFRENLLISSSSHGQQVLGSNTNMHGDSGSGKSYSVINTHKAMLLCTLPFFGNSWCKNTDLIPRFMRSVFISKPPKPRYIAMWDVSIVLRFLESLGKNSDLSLKILTFKTVALVALAIAPRAQTLISLCLNNMIVEKDAIVFMISDILKTTAHVRTEHFRNESLCVMHTLLDYIEATKKVRLSNSLFISYVTFKKVTTSTIARWLKLTLSLAGIDMEVFKAHSFRGAATSAAFNRGCSLKSILKTANWKSDKNFRKFYYRQSLRKQDISFSNALFTL
ncbi:hypothetical protein MAR_023400 [Mya arenaria]|uniref:Tyr recombinase domain-containing protein n=1 Tax=Mya arenaria TaxID=6604 RepID=A0ABY7DMV2_MYAAR|nr:hypothetical protein MAR_023400 [Mya arenaria]